MIAKFDKANAFMLETLLERFERIENETRNELK